MPNIIAFTFSETPLGCFADLKLFSFFADFSCLFVAEINTLSLLSSPFELFYPNFTFQLCLVGVLLKTYTPCRTISGKSPKIGAGILQTKTHCSESFKYKGDIFARGGLFNFEHFAVNQATGNLKPLEIFVVYGTECISLKMGTITELSTTSKIVKN